MTKQLAMPCCGTGYQSQRTVTFARIVDNVTNAKGLENALRSTVDRGFGVYMIVSVEHPSGWNPNAFMITYTPTSKADLDLAEQHIITELDKIEQIIAQRLRVNRLLKELTNESND